MQYAVLFHSEIDEPHFDLLVETAAGSDLATWRLPVWPVEFETDVTRLKDHRRFYLAYEGEIASHRGRVERVAGGECDVEAGVDSALTIHLRTGGAVGKLELRKIVGDNWRASPV
jgi:hypothetical protein